MRFSPTQISSYLSCPRQWGWRYLARIPSEPTASQSLGTAVHKQLENYLNGQPFDFSGDAADIAASGLQFLPAGAVTTEGEFEFTYQGVTFFGYKDFELFGHIGDHKTTSNLKWMKTEEDLRSDIQANIYAWDGFLKWPELDRVRLTWIYYQTKGARVADCTSFEIEREHVQEVMDAIVPLARLLERRREEALDGRDVNAYVLSLPPEPSSCEMYGGCPYRGRCNLSPIERMKSIMSGESAQDILARLRGATFNPPEAAQTIPAPPPPVPIIPAQPPTTVLTGQNAKAADAVIAAVSEEAAKALDKVGPVSDLSKNPPKEKSKKCVLYVGCKPTGVHQTFEELLQKVQEEILKTRGKSDWRYIEFTGAGVLLETFKQMFEASVPAKLVVAYPESPEARIILPWLSTRCTDQVVRA